VDAVTRIAILVSSCLWLIAPAAAQSTREAIESVQPRMVKIFGAGGLRGLHEYSTGFLVSADGHVATAWSHVLDAEEVSVVLHDGRRYFAEVLGAEPALDLAVLKIRGENLSLPFFELAEDSAAAGPGTRVLAFSNMFKVASGDEAVSVVQGVIAARTRLSARRGSFEAAYVGQVYVVDAVTNNSGAEGGLLTTRDGKLLGMIGKVLRDTRSNTWLNYSIPIADLREPIQQIIIGDFSSQPKPADAESPRRYEPLDFGLVMVPDVLFRTPAYVDSVLPNSPADAAGLKPDDFVLFVNEELIQSCRLLREELGRLEAGDTLRLIIRRNDQLVTVELPVRRKEAK
jgi:serine protease Do